MSKVSLRHQKQTGFPKANIGQPSLDFVAIKMFFLFIFQIVWKNATFPFMSETVRFPCFLNSYAGSGKRQKAPLTVYELGGCFCNYSSKWHIVTFKNVQSCSMLRIPSAYSSHKTSCFGFVGILIDFGFIEVCGCFPSMNKNEMSSFKSIERKTMSSIHSTTLLIFLLSYAAAMHRGSGTMY